MLWDALRTLWDALGTLLGRSGYALGRGRFGDALGTFRALERPGTLQGRCGHILERSATLWEGSGGSLGHSGDALGSSGHFGKAAQGRAWDVLWGGGRASMLGLGFFDVPSPRSRVKGWSDIGYNLAQTGWDRLWDALGRSGTLWDVLGGWKFWDVLKSSGRLRDALGRFGALWDALGHWDVLGQALKGSGAPWDVLGSFGTLWEALGGSGTLRDALGRSGTLGGTL